MWGFGLILRRMTLRSVGLGGDAGTRKLRAQVATVDAGEWGELNGVRCVALLSSEFHQYFAEDGEREA